MTVYTVRGCVKALKFYSALANVFVIKYSFLSKNSPASVLRKKKLSQAIKYLRQRAVVKKRNFTATISR